MSQSSNVFQLWRIVQVPVFLFGAMMASVMLLLQIDILPTFIDSRYDGFWNDIRAYELQSEGHKSLPELFDAYGEHYVHNQVILHPLTSAFTPSDDAAIVYYTGNVIKNVDGQPRFEGSWLGLVMIAYIVAYLPMSAFAGAMVRNWTWVFCRSNRAAQCFAEYYDVPMWRRITGAVGAFPVVVVLALIGAIGDWDADLRRVGFSLFDLTIIAVFQSYIGGLGMRVVRGMIDGLFIVSGVNVERTLIDDLLAVAITGPILIFVYGNSPVSILADTAAGLGPMLIGRLAGWIAARRSRVLEVEVAADGPRAIARNLYLAIAATVASLPWCCCGILMPIAEAPQYQTVTMPVAEFEERGSGKSKSVVLTDGYLFWPLLVPVPPPTTVISFGQETEAYRYYVPLVSKEVLDEWLTEYRRGHKPKSSNLRGHVMVSFIPEEFHVLFPDVRPGKFDPQQPYAAFQVNGTTDPFFSEHVRVPASVMDEVGDALSYEAVLVKFRDDSTLMRYSFIMAAVLSLLSALPLPLRWFYAGFKHRGEGIPIVVVTDPVPTLKVVEAEPVVPQVEAVPETVAAVHEPLYHYRIMGQTRGPVSLLQLRELVRTGKLRSDDLVQIRGKWRRADEVPGLFKKPGR